MSYNDINLRDLELKAEETPKQSLYSVDELNRLVGLTTDDLADIKKSSEIAEEPEFEFSDDGDIEFTVSDGDDINIDISDDDIGIEVEEDFDVSDMDLFGDNDEDVEVDFDEDEKVTLNPALLGFEQADVIANLDIIAGLIVNANTPILGRSLEVDVKECVLNYQLFDMVPPEAVRVIEAALRDVALNDVKSNTVNIESAVQEVLDATWEVVGWAPVGDVSKVKANIALSYEKFTTILGTVSVDDKNSLKDYIDADRFEFLKKVLITNTEVFSKLDKVFLALQKLGDISLDNPTPGAKIFGKNKLLISGRPAPVSTYTTAIINYFQSEEISEYLGLSLQALQDFSIGELTRRLVLRDMSAYPEMLEEISVNSEYSKSVEDIIDWVCRGYDNKVTSCEIILLLCSLLDQVLSAKDNDTETVNNILYYFGEYCEAIREAPELVHVSFYTAVTKTESGSYIIDYPVNNGVDVKSVEAPDLLFEIVGNEVKAYTVPLGICDQKHKYFILPPHTVIQALQATTMIPTYKLDGKENTKVLYRTAPTLEWVERYNIVGQDNMASDNYEAGINPKDLILYNFITSYSNEFIEDEITPPVISVFETPNFTLYAMLNEMGEEANLYSLLALSRNNADGTGKHIVVQGKVIKYRDDELICEFIMNGTSHNVTFHSGEYGMQETVMGTGEHETFTRPQYFDYYEECPMVTSLPSDKEDIFSKARVVSKRLCRMTGLSYDLLLEEARVLISERLCYILQLDTIDKILLSGILHTYKGLKTDGYRSQYNITTLQELVDISGCDAEASRRVLGDNAWETEVDNVVDYCEKNLSGTVQRYVKFLANVNLQLLALEILEHKVPMFAYSTNTIEYREMYNALLQIPQVREYFRLLEEYIVVVQITFEHPEVIAAMLRRDQTLASIIRTGIGENDGKQASKLSKLKKKVISAGQVDGQEPTLKVVNALLMANIRDSSSMVKYFIMSRDLYHLIQELDRTSNRSLSSNLKYNIGLDITANMEVMTQEEFNSLVSREQVDKTFVDFYPEFLDLIYEGLLSELHSRQLHQQILLYDLVCDFGRILVPFKDEDIETMCSDIDEQAFYAYANSMILSYVPVEMEATLLIQGGTTRDVLYAQSPELFVLPEYFQRSDVVLRDLRLTMCD